MGEGGAVLWSDGVADLVVVCALVWSVMSTQTIETSMSSVRPLPIQKLLKHRQNNLEESGTKIAAHTADTITDSMVIQLVATGSDFTWSSAPTRLINDERAPLFG